MSEEGQRPLVVPPRCDRPANSPCPDPTDHGDERQQRETREEEGEVEDAPGRCHNKEGEEQVKPSKMWSARTIGKRGLVKGFTALGTFPDLRVTS